MTGFVLAAVALAVAAGLAALCYRERRQRAALAAGTIACCHDVRGILSPALLIADRLTSHPDPAIREQAEAMAQAIERAAKGLQPAAALAHRSRRSAPSRKGGGADLTR